MATEREKWRKLLDLLPLPVETSEKYGTILAELETSGEVIGNNDLWIAAHAMAAGLILVNKQRESISTGSRTEGSELGKIEWLALQGTNAQRPREVTRRTRRGAWACGPR